MQLENKIEKYIIILVIILCGCFLQRKYINEFPSHIHAWTQSDRYALAIGFVKNNFDFFHPQTFVLNHQFPGGFLVPSENTITSVEFPIHDFMPAIIMKFFNTTSPWCFRLYIFLYSLIGLFFLYKISNILFTNIYKSVILIVFAATSPVFVYYQSGFLPTIPSLANGFIGIYFYLRHLKNKNNNSFYFCLFFLTLSALSRTPFSILFIAIVFSEFIYSTKIKSIELKKIYAIVLSLFSIIGYFLYNNYLKNKYGSMFLSHTMAPTNTNEIKEIIMEIKQKWLYQYFSKTHYFILIVIGLICIFLFAKNNISINYIQKKLFLIFVLIAIGNITYSYLMFKQFAEHDYYFLDTFYTLFIIGFAILLSLIPVFKNKYQNFIIIPVTFTIIFLLIFNAEKEQENRRKISINDATEQTIKNFNRSKEFLDSLKISKNARLLDLCSFAPNIPFILMDRKGFATLTTSMENIKLMLKLNYDFIVLQNEFLVSEIYSNYPEIINKLKKIGDNGKISVYKFFDSDKKKTLIDFLELNNKEPILYKKITFDSVPDKEWFNIKSTTFLSYSGKSSGFVTNTDEYGITFKLNNLKVLKSRSCLLNFKSYFLENNKTFKNCFLVISLNTQKEKKYYKAIDIANLIKHENTWEQVELNFQLPQVNYDDFEIGIYIWNSGHNLLYYDDIKIQIY